MDALSDHYVSLDFTGWRYVELLARERDVERMHDYIWPYGGIGSHAIYRTPLDMAHISQVAIYLNNLPVGKSVEVTLSPVMALPTQSVVLKNPTLVLNGQTLALPLTLASGDFAEIEPDGLCTHYNAKGDPLASVRPVTLPLLRVGENAIRFDCERPQGVSARAEVTINAFGTPFGTPNPRRKIDWKHLEREYEMTRVFLSSNDLANASWDVVVRPGEKAELEIELCGSMTSPALTINGHTLHFPVTLKAGQRLICRDRRTWTILDAKRVKIAEGSLDTKVPVLSSGPNRVSFTCANPDRAQVKLVKVYE